MREYWSKWQALGWIQPVDEMMGRYLYKWITQSSDSHAEVIASLAIVLSRAASLGHACLPLDKAWPEEIRMLVEFFPKSDELLTVVRSSEWVDDQSKARVLQDAPLWLSSGDKLYLKRFANYEEAIADWVSAQRSRVFDCDAQHACQVMGGLFGTCQGLEDGDQDNFPKIDWQRIAVSIAIRFPLIMIAGGPGTGKTTTVVKLLAALQALSDKTLSIVVAAPTGKAAARLADSLLRQRDQLVIDEAVKESLPQTTHTVHRLLEWNPTQQCFGRNQGKPIPADVVVIDEASMLDLYMAQSLIKALKPNARLIFLGDSNQLPAVESGAVFQHVGTIAMQGACHHHLDWLKATGCVPLSFKISDLAGRVGAMAVTLRDSYRFNDKSELGAIALAVLQGNSRMAIDLVQRCGWFVDRVDLVELARNKWEKLPKQATVCDALDLFQRFRLLAASRKLVVQMNAELTKRFNPDLHQHYKGQPIMVVVNDYRKLIFNGDVGIVWPDCEGNLVAWFWVESKLRPFNLHGLPKWETCYAMTVHKSQGSEFDEVGIVFPDGDGGTLTRQWLYTAITRAKSTVFFSQSIDQFVSAVESVIVRETDFLSFIPKLPDSQTVVEC